MALNYHNLNKVFQKSKLQDKSANKTKLSDPNVSQKDKLSMFKIPSKLSSRNPGKQLRIHTVIDITDDTSEEGNGYQTPKFKAQIKQFLNKDNFFSFGQNIKIKNQLNIKILNNQTKPLINKVKQKNLKQNTPSKMRQQKSQKDGIKYVKKHKLLSPTNYGITRDRIKTEVNLKKTQAQSGSFLIKKFY